MTGNVSLSICGDVERPARLALDDLRALMDAELVADFHCREGWSVKSVDRIEVTRQPQQATAETIALARIQR
jgi:hypothetical protein